MAVNPQARFSEQYEMEDSLIDARNDAQRKDKHIGGAVTYIWITAMIAAIPMLILSSILLGLTFVYRLDQTDQWFTSSDSPNASSDTSAYYLDFSATRFVTAASWSSNIAPHLSTFILVLFSYRVSLMFWSSFQKNATSQYPTPFQLSLLLQAFSGGLTAFVNLGKYGLWKKRKRMPTTVKFTYWMLLVTLLLGYAVWAADTWLHVTTSAVNLARSNTNTSAYNLYGRTLSCSSDDSSYNSTNSCSIRDGGLSQISEAFWTLNNISSNHAVSTFQTEEGNYAYLTSPNIVPGVNYEASTYAIQTQCATTPYPCEISCGTVGDLVEVDFTCNALQSTLIGTSSTLRDINASLIYLSSGDPAAAKIVPYTQTNPFSFATLAMTKSFNTNLDNDAEHSILCQGDEGAAYMAWMVVCNATVYDVDYIWTNGTFDHIVSKTLSNNAVAATLSTPFGTNIGGTTLMNAALTASGEGNAVALANTFSLVFSKTAMALAAGATNAVLNAGEGETLIGTRVEKAPLFTLVCFNLLYTVLALGLLVAVLLSDLTKSNDIQARISVVGLVAQCFEGQRTNLPVNEMEQIFAEWEGESVQRVGVVETDKGGWKYELFKQE